mgnify:CR=1 FL=1
MSDSEESRLARACSFKRPLPLLPRKGLYRMTQDELRYLLGSAYTRFYMRPSFLANYLRISAPRVRAFVDSLDARVERRHERVERQLAQERLRVAGSMPGHS